MSYEQLADKVSYVSVLFSLSFLVAITFAARRVNTSFIEVSRWIGWLEFGLCFFWIAAVASPVDLIYDRYIVVGWIDDLGYVFLAVLTVSSALRRPIFY